MLGKKFYYKCIRNYTQLMGVLFSDIQVLRERQDGDRYINVPITYASKENYARKLQSRLEQANTNGQANIRTILPRMSLEITDMAYDSQRRGNNVVRSAKYNSDGKYKGFYNPVPWNITYTLSIWTRHESDAFQIVEQIIPFFDPTYTAKIKEHVGDSVENRNVDITLSSVIPQEDIMGAPEEQRRIEWSIIFILKGYIYPPEIDFDGVIKRVYLDFYGNTVNESDKGNFESYDIESCDDQNSASKKSMSENEEIPTDSTIRGQGGECINNE